MLAKRGGIFEVCAITNPGFILTVCFAHAAARRRTCPRDVTHGAVSHRGMLSPHNGTQIAGGEDKSPNFIRNVVQGTLFAETQLE